MVTALFSSVLTIMGLMKLLGLGGEKTTDLLRFFGVMRMIETRYVTDVDSSTLMDGAIDGMVKSLGDPHSIYMKTAMYKSLKEHTAGTFGGIGVTMGFKDDKVTIMSVLEGTPGEKVGLSRRYTGDGVPARGSGPPYPRRGRYRSEADDSPRGGRGQGICH